jgi:hypothetical protein
VIVIQHLLIQLCLHYLHLILILLSHGNDLISDSHPYSLHLLQILPLILTIEQIRVPFYYNLLKEILPKVFLNEVPYLLGLALEHSDRLEDLVDGHVEEAVLRGLQLLEVLQPRVELLLGVVELEGLQVEFSLHFLQTLV